ncbi:hypothetical protein PG993_000594 [Apiospora rasikravindrae]|uniref:Uncharacterized protein n=1 Tax=Apiospora rasikravindrae TaxID=990691 RepID=A0ABR1U902_9PEZI
MEGPTDITELGEVFRQPYGFWEALYPVEGVFFMVSDIVDKAFDFHPASVAAETATPLQV